MKCCIDVISLKRYQLVAVMSSQFWHCDITTHHIEAWRGVWLYLCIFVYKEVSKCVFFLSWSTQVYLCVFVQVSIGNGWKRWGGWWMLNNEQFKQTGKRWCSHTLKVQSALSLLTELLSNHKDFWLTCTTETCQQRCDHSVSTIENDQLKTCCSCQNHNSQPCWLFLQVRFRDFFLRICKLVTVKYILL